VIYANAISPLVPPIAQASVADTAAASLSPLLKVGVAATLVYAEEAMWARRRRVRTGQEPEPTISAAATAPITADRRLTNPALLIPQLQARRPGMPPSNYRTTDQGPLPE
jgi:hypothetical protein